jgi:tetratricopeptide (TPR) repeat protein
MRQLSMDRKLRVHPLVVALVLALIGAPMATACGGSQTRDEALLERGELPDGEEALWEAIERRADSGDVEKTAEAVEKYRRNHGADPRHQDRLMEGMIRVGQLHAAAGARDRARGWFSRVIDRYEKGGVEFPRGSKEHAAEAMFRMSELRYEQWKAEQLDLGESGVTGFETQIRELARDLALLEKTYVEIVEFGAREWSIAAMFRIGSLYEQFGRKLNAIDLGDDVSAEQAEYVRAFTGDRARPFFEKATVAYENTLRAAKSRNIASEWTEKARERKRIIEETILEADRADGAGRIDSQ